jgi:hypothetical protein
MPESASPFRGAEYGLFFFSVVTIFTVEDEEDEGVIEDGRVCELLTGAEIVDGGLKGVTKLFEDV